MSPPDVSIPDDLYPPVTHGSAWALLGIGLLVVVVLWWLGVWWRTRPRRSHDAVWTPLKGKALEARRASSVAELDAVLAAHEAGGTSTREAFQRLSPLVREFVFDAAGIPAHTMSLSDLEREQPGALADVVGLMYPAEFAAVVDGDVRVGAERARRVVLEWTPDAAPTVPVPSGSAS